MAPSTSPSLRLGGTTRAEQVLSAWNADKKLTDKTPVRRAIALGQQVDAAERKLSGQRTVINEGYQDQGLAKVAGDKVGAAHAAAVLDASFKDNDGLVRLRDAARINTNAVVAPLVSFYEGPSTDPTTGRRGPATAKPYTLLKPVRLQPTNGMASLALSKDVELDEIDAEIAKAEDSVPDLASAKAKLKQDLDTLAASGALGVHWAGPFRGNIRWPEVNINAAPRVAGFRPRAVDTSALFVRHFRTAIEGEAVAALEAFYGGADVLSLSPQDRHNELRKLRSTRRAVERIRIEAAWAAIANGEDIGHRTDSDPWLLLGIEKPI